MAQEYRVRYADRPELCMTVTLIRTWQRGEIVPVSGGSGMKLYLKNLVWSAFEATPQASAIHMVRGGGPPFLILRVGQKHFDVTGKEVEISPKKSPPGGLS